MWNTFIVSLITSLIYCFIAHVINVLALCYILLNWLNPCFSHTDCYFLICYVSQGWISLDFHYSVPAYFLSISFSTGQSLCLLPIWKLRFDLCYIYVLSYFLIIMLFVFWFNCVHEFGFELFSCINFIIRNAILNIDSSWLSSCWSTNTSWIYLSSL